MNKGITHTQNQAFYPKQSICLTKRKSVSWSTITVYEFGVALGGSSVPKRGGPAIGLAKKPQCVWSTTVDAVKRRKLCVCRSVDRKTDSAKCKLCEHGTRRSSRVRWFKPLERINLLEKAGYSEEKIYNMLIESSNISMSRRLNLRQETHAA